MKNIIKNFFNHETPPTINIINGLIIIKTNRSLMSALVEDSHIEIGDIQTYRSNHGTGTAMMNLLIEYAKQNNIHSIKGWISDVDMGHFDRLEHFYQKFGFTITPNKDIKSIKKYFIELYL